MDKQFPFDFRRLPRELLCTGAACWRSQLSVASSLDIVGWIAGGDSQSDHDAA